MNTSRERSDHVSIRIDEKLAHLSCTSSERCICRVHDRLRSENEKDYEPAMVAIGPYHRDRGKANLQEMEEHKLRYLHQLLERRKETSVDRYVVAIRELEERARKCYAQTISLDTDEFVEMLLLDGCFIIELFRKNTMKGLIVEDDPIFESRQTRFGLRRDLILLENQLPFFILVQLFNMSSIPSPQDNIINMALRFLKHIIHTKQSEKYLEAPKGIQIDDIKHLLGLLHDSWCSSFTETRRDVEHKAEKWEFINSATELQEVGVQFKMVDRSNMFDIKFVNRVLEMPRLRITNETESTLKNLIAYEQYLSGNQPNYICDYITFMNSLINSSKDVQLLRRKGIIRNWLADDEVAYTMLNKMDKHIGMSSKKFTYSKVFNDMNKHCKQRRNEWMEILRRNYFNSPWALVSFLAAVILLLLTMTQTIFSVLSVSSK